MTDEERRRAWEDERNRDKAKMRAKMEEPVPAGAKARREAEYGRAEKLKVLVAKGHGNCLEAIKLEPNINVRKQRLQTYVNERPNITQRRQAKRLLALIQKDFKKT